MSFSEFIHECSTNQSISITHVICTSKDTILAKYVKPPYQMNTLRLFFSMTKSFSSLAIGIASDLGMLNIDDFIVKFFDNELPQNPDENLNKITIRHLLTMSSGIHENTYAELFIQNNWIKAFLKQTFPHEPGTYYRYSTHGSHMLSAIITKVSSLSLEAFLNKYLFYPMDIYEAQWEQSPENLTAGGMGLSLYPMSLVKIAQLLLNKGVYNRTHLISKQYIETATKQQIIKQDDINSSDSFFEGTGYGFQFHIGKDGFYRLDGAFGQLCLICPRKNLAVIIFSQYSKIEALLSLVYKHLLGDMQIFNDLATSNKNLKLEVTKSVEIPYKRFRLGYNSLGIESIEFTPVNNEYNLIINSKYYTDIVKFSLSHSTTGQMHFIKDLQNHLQAYTCTAKFNKFLKLTIYLVETPYVTTLSFTFNNNEVYFDFSINVSLSLKSFSVYGSSY